VFRIGSYHFHYELQLATNSLFLSFRLQLGMQTLWLHISAWVTQALVWNAYVTVRFRSNMCMRRAVWKKLSVAVIILESMVCCKFNNTPAWFFADRLMIALTKGCFLGWLSLIPQVQVHSMCMKSKKKTKFGYMDCIPFLQKWLNSTCLSRKLVRGADQSGRDGRWRKVAVGGKFLCSERNFLVWLKIPKGI